MQRIPCIAFGILQLNHSGSSTVDIGEKLVSATTKFRVQIIKRLIRLFDISDPVAKLGSRVHSYEIIGPSRAEEIKFGSKLLR